MITDEQFKDYIGQIGDSYERMKDIVQGSEIGWTDLSGKIIGELQTLRDTACQALRDSHTQKNFDQN